MDKNLLLTILIVETIIFIWLIKESILAVSNFNIFGYLNNWFRGRPIIFPSICFLVFPFVVFGTTNNSLLLLTNSNNSSLFTWLTTILTSIISASFVFINNRYSERLKTNKEQKEIVNLIIPTRCSLSKHFC
ncbi:hypothetical protein STA3757_14820 [Stanieria sp. NIES-3757]|nr:hypothetical protein STA3757_14820 [Stanieria sp. NIES-3757]